MIEKTLLRAPNGDNDACKPYRRVRSLAAALALAARRARRFGAPALAAFDLAGTGSLFCGVETRWAALLVAAGFSAAAAVADSVPPFFAVSFWSFGAELEAAFTVWVSACLEGVDSPNRFGAVSFAARLALACRTLGLSAFG